MIRYIAAVLLVTSASAHAISGNELHDAMKEYYKVAESKPGARALLAGRALGYVEAMSSYGQMVGRICLPDNSNAGQTFDVAFQYIDNNPAQRHRDAAVLVDAALTKSFPCKK